MALALTKLRFSLPCKAARTSALALLELVARREARSENDSIASVTQAPYASTTMGTQIHPSSLHLASIVFSAQFNKHLEYIYNTLYTAINNSMYLSKQSYWPESSD